MNKRIFAAVMVTMVLVASLVAGALAAASGPVAIEGPQTVQSGETVTLTIAGIGDIEGVNADIETVGLEMVSYSGGLSDQESILLLSDYGGLTATYVYRVTAADGQTVSFELQNVITSSNLVDTPQPNVSWSAPVGAAAPSGSPSSSESPSGEPSPSESATDSASPSGEPSANPSESASPSASASDSAAPSQSGSASQAPSQSTAPQPTISGGTPSASGGAGGGNTTTAPSGSNGGNAGTTTTGGTNQNGTTVVRLPKTADSTTNMWIFAILTAAVGTIAIIAAKKCTIHKSAEDEQ